MTDDFTDERSLRSALICDLRARGQTDNAHAMHNADKPPAPPTTTAPDFWLDMRLDGRAQFVLAEVDDEAAAGALRGSSAAARGGAA